MFLLSIKGSIPEEDSGKLYNTCPVFGPDGALLVKHRKVSRTLVSVAQLLGASSGKLKSCGSVPGSVSSWGAYDKQ